MTALPRSPNDYYISMGRGPTANANDGRKKFLDWEGQRLATAPLNSVSRCYTLQPAAADPQTMDCLTILHKL